jgi:hypothetical protein
MNNDLVTTVQAAGIIGVGRHQVWHLIKTGQLRATRIGKGWFVSRKHAESYRPKKRGPKKSA